MSYVTELRAYPGWSVTQTGRRYVATNGGEWTSEPLASFDACIAYVRERVHNPHREQHIQGELDFTGGGYTRSMARRAVAFEYEGAAPAFPCRCGGPAHYRATIGVHKCTACGELYHGDGSPV